MAEIKVPIERIKRFAEEYGISFSEAQDQYTAVAKDLAKTPVEPDLSQVRQCLRSGEDPDGKIPYPGYAVKAFMEWQRQMFVASPERNPVVDRIRYTLAGQTITSGDAVEIIHYVQLCVRALERTER